MKFACHFGSTIYDGIDDIPNKARFMSDQGWCAKWDELDEHVIGASAAGQVTVNAAAKKARDIFLGDGLRSMWQCETLWKAVFG